MWANLEGWALLWRKAGRGETPGQKLYAWIAPPEWEPGPAPVLAISETSPAELPFAKKLTVAVLFTINLTLVLSFFIFGRALTVTQAALCATGFVVAWGGLAVYLDKK